MADSIQIKLPDGSTKEVPKGTTPLDVAKSISPRLADAALVAKTNGDLIDLTRPLDRDAELRILTEKDPEALEVYRHSSAHLLAAAVLELFPETKLGHGPATDSGFFYDFYRPTPFTPEDLEKIERKMQELAQQNIPYAREFLPRDEGLQKFKGEGDFMKCHYIEQFTKPDEKISIYKTGNFLDFCRGPHIPSTGKIKAFKLLNIAGAYWLGDEKNPQLQRIYGTSFFSKKDLDSYLNQIEEAKKRDHRVLGKQLDLFSIQELAGPGLIFWHPKGGIIRKEMEDWMRDQYLKRGYSLVYTPHVMRKQLWQTSGHEGYYSQNMIDVTELSTWNPDDKKNFVGSEGQWNLATSSLEKVLKRLGIEYKTIPGEAAFYGPKIDIKLVDAIGRLWQLSTVQFDFNLPARFALEYVAQDGTRKQPVMVHRALYGSMERFFGVLIEHYAGAFPVWLSPVQVMVIPISERHAEYANKVADQLKAVGVRVDVDARNEKMNAKIREHALQKVPFLLVVGDKESEAGKVNVRTRGKEKTEDMLVGEFVEKIKTLIEEKSPAL